ncbi:hypothetical protein HD806DRAFT_332921 [Xylariaceae sp. AK1471]|nr:hypothetical protein HD806DRAFT_332921 [Xylariaceae sp. AK1471]
MSMILPTPRDLLTSLISSLTSIPITDNAATNTAPSHRSSNQHAGASSSTNPLRLIPPAYRPLLTTLHVLYPSTLLPALDLLDRRLVTRVILKQDTPHSTTYEHQSAAYQDSEEETTATATTGAGYLNPQEGKIVKPIYHLVRSAQPQSNRRHHAHHPPTSSGQVYVVRLESWNCSCAAFAFSAFPPLPSPSTYEVFPATAPQDTGESDQTWEFGGLSTDGRDTESGITGGTGGGGVPCCKHLLACVLAEKWDAVLGRYIEERVVGREEGAGLVDDL